MTLHQLFVHFPIAFLSLYAILELIRFKRFVTFPSAFYMKATLLFFGILGAVAALLTGDLDSHNYGESVRPLINTHEMFAQITFVIFLIIACAYAIEYVSRSHQKLLERNHRINRTIAGIRRIMSPTLVVFFAFVGLITLTITGGLGAAIAYGPHADPIVSFFVNILNLAAQK